jgi:hypothetical protein
VIAGVSLNSHKPWVSLDRTVKDNGIEPCPLSEQRKIFVTWPSGHTVEVLTDAKGRANLDAPSTEPDYGTVSVTSGGTVARATYYRDLAACEAARTTQLEHANTLTSKRTAALEAIPHCAAIAVGAPKQRERAFELAIGAAIAASRGECRMAHDAEEAVKNLDPAVHATVFNHPEVRGCIAREAARQSKMTPCTLARADAMRAAQTIKDPNARGEALRKIPQCKPGE